MTVRVTEVQRLTRRGASILRLLFFAFFVFSSISCALAKTGVRAIDERAIAVKVPDKVFLDAVARVGDRLVAAGVHGVIIYSDDNGVTWKQAKVPVSVELTAVSFASATDGWAVGHYGVILRTTDAGETWQLQLNGIQANRLTLAAAQAAVAGNNPSPGTALAIKRAKFFENAGPDKPFLTLWTPSPREALVLGAYRLAMKTIDGGKTWTDWSLHIADSLSHNLYDITPVGGQLFVAAETGLIFRSADGGNSFVKLMQPGNATLFGVIGTGDQGVLAFGVAGQAYWSGDSGNTWRAVTLGTNANLTSACMLNNGAIVVASESGTLYISPSHRNKFRMLPIALPMAAFDIVQAANDDLVIVGSSGIARVSVRNLQ